MDGQEQNHLQLYDGKWLPGGASLTDFSTQVSELNTWHSAW